MSVAEGAGEGRSNGKAVKRKPRRREEPGGQAATLMDVAAHAGVSLATVSRVLANNYPVAQSTRQRVMRSIRELNYVANTHARALAGITTNTVALVLKDIRGASFAAAIHGAEEEAARRGWLCLVCSTGGDPERELAAIQLMREQRACAVVLIGGVVESEEYLERTAEIAKALDQAGSRLVLCGRPPLGPDTPTTVVEYDNEAGAYTATAHLLAQGHRRILFLGGDPQMTTSLQRQTGYRRALEDFGVAPDPALLETTLAYTRGSGYRRTADRLAGGRDFTAVFAETDVIATGALAALTDAGLRVPEDVSLVGYDDIDVAVDLRPQLTTVHVPYEELGRTAVRLVHEHRQRPDENVGQYAMIGTHLTIRQSVARHTPAG
ncbi:MAG TPA: LacI family DNA-binding transcriptional regulator [Actinospica sp.]|jgi:LacI family transcriptional regulator|nr:LacI family DNA-binding transcriptional regulator [Actinospica sp.]